MSISLKQVFESALTQWKGSPVKINNLKDLAGGCINRAVRAETSEGVFFIKSNSGSKKTLFETEAQGLQILKATGVIDIPEVLSVGQENDVIYLIMEFIEKAPPEKQFWENFGISLAELHKVTNEHYGLKFDNYIGSLPQSNAAEKDWIVFFREQRLQPQLKLAFDTGKSEKKTLDLFECLFLKLSDLLVPEKPSLLHGDLWSGNFMINAKGSVTLIDPAVYFGHREAELAFTTLFGGFDERFYRSYSECWPLEPGYENRFDIYNLYPLLVHVNLFGGSYIQSVNSILRKFE